MKTTAAVLRTLQDYYASLEIRPGIKEVAKITNMPVATAGRYLNGTTQQGDIERVRALCIALDRQDLLDELPKTQIINSFQEAMALVLEVKRESRESNLEELERVRKLHDEAEKRLERIVESKDKSIDMLTKRIEKLEKDKETQTFFNVELNTEMNLVRRRKRQYEAIVVGLFLVLLLYFIIFDLPYPDSGITEVILNIFH